MEPRERRGEKNWLRLSCVIDGFPDPLSLSHLSHALVPIGDSFSSALERQRARATGGAGIERGREGKRERTQNTQLRISEVLIQSTSINQSYNPSQRCSSLYSTVYFSFISFGTRVCVCVCVSFFLFFLVVSRSELSVCLNLHHPLL